MPLVIRLLLFLLASVPVSAEALPEMTPVLGKRGELLGRMDLTVPGQAPPTAKLGLWKIVDGALYGEERVEDHHQAAITPIKQLTLGDCIVQVDVRSAGATQFAVGFNRKPGLLPRGPDGKIIGKRAHAVTVAFDQDPAKSMQWRVEDASLKPFATLGSHPLTAEPGKWYRLLVEIRGEEVCATLSNGQQVRSKAVAPDDPKDGPVLRCRSASGHGAYFANIWVWALNPD